ncbi:MAG: hypothetical protein K9K86_09435, partial [Pseudomonadales bacterium]|nr:hypothetical protein [Pseudomonadales bacterium]
MNSILKYIVHKIWLIAVLALVMVAVYVSLGRVMLPRLHQYQEPLQSYLSQKLGSPVHFEQLQGDWQGFQPVLSLHHFSLQTSSHKEALTLRDLIIRLDVFQSMLQWRPVFSVIKLEGIELRLRRNQEGKWQLEDSPSPSETGNQASSLVALLLAQGKIEIRDSRLILLFDGDQQKQLNVGEWQLHCALDVCSSEGQFMLDGDEAKQLSFVLNMANQPGEKNFQLEAYAQWDPLPLDAWLPVTGVNLPVKLKMDAFQLGGEIWFNIENGRLVDVRGGISAPKLSLAPAEQNLAPIEALHTRFFWYKDEADDQKGWRLVLKDFGFKWQEEIFASEQQDWSFVQEADQQSLTLVADAVELQFFSHMLLSFDPLPDSIRNLLVRLRPHGRLTNAHLQYRLTDEKGIDDLPLFSLEANLDEVGVSAWKSAPAVDGVNGYLKVTPSGGMVDFSSTDFSIFFPKLYSDRWHYEQPSGAVHWKNEGRSFWL